MGGPDFFGVVKEGEQFFFLHMPRRDQKKLVTCDHRQMPPLPVKNDSSLMTDNSYFL